MRLAQGVNDWVGEHALRFVENHWAFALCFFIMAIVGVCYGIGWTFRVGSFQGAGYDEIMDAWNDANSVGTRSWLGFDVC